jgi:SAM-dependent methyltransferase
MGTPQYLFDNSATEAGQRFGALAALFNSVTFRHMEALGIAEGWSCWEVGAGGPSVAGWMQARVGAAGRVLATDIDISWIDEHGSAGFEVRHHDVAHDLPPEDGFDLIHARLVLIHVPARDEALRRIASTLRPGGWLLIEDFDMDLQPLRCLDQESPAGRLANKIHDGLRELLVQRGAAESFGRTLPSRFRELGLEDVAADAYFPVSLPASMALSYANVSQLRERLIERGLATQNEIDRYLSAAASGDIDVVTPPLVSAWGRRALA